MQVNPLTSRNVVPTEKSLKQGEVLRGTSIQPISETEATINVRGKELTVKVDGKMPTSNSATFIVTSVDEDGIRVQEWNSKEASQSPKLSTGSQSFIDANESPSNETILKSRSSLMEAAMKSGVNRPTGLLLDAMTLVQASGRPLSEETIRELANFLKSSSDQPKLQTVEALLSKDLPIRESHLQAIHETRTGKPLNDIVKGLEQQLQPKDQNITSLKDRILQQLLQLTSGKQLSNVQQALVTEFKSQLSQAISVDKIDQVSRLISKTIQTDQDFQGKLEQPKSVEPIDTFKTPEVPKVVLQQKDQLNQLAQTIELEENPHKAIESIQSVLQKQLILESDQIRRLSDQLEVASTRLNAGRELAARTVLSTAIEAELSILPTQLNQFQPEERNDRFMLSEQVQPIHSKQIAVTTVTDKMAQLTNEFKDFQSETVRTLRQIQVDLTTPNRTDTHASKNQLDSIIRKLDHSILRGEAMQFADMKTEKQLMLSSSKLAEARQHLSAGRSQQAADIVAQVQKQVESITYKPSETKVVAESALQQLNQDHKKSQTTPLFQMEEAAAKAKAGTARGTFEAIKQLGLNQEADFAQKFSQRESQKDVPLERNLKQSLMQLVRSQDDGGKTTQLASQALQHVTGQQLLSKQDAQPLQSLFFQLPLVLEQKVEQLQCYIQSKKEGEQVDWQNCSLYFLMETPKLGEIGISIKAVQRQLSVTLTNDQKDFRLKMEPLVEKAIAKVEEVGYSISSISFSPFSKNQNPESIQSPKNQVYSSDKGFDLKI
ncbi:hypothetical protein [Alkalicoccobacillus gibsonii]|uniref:hypothetical protein n=1 Tax=Alkalicoccobacillus gibsonii TaxID=79881 RepID=UPI0019326C8E|nr:hypothetical protein [Alkalicoccobacillus gibsonii]MBM0064405.1 hypothetical protein [Alkalicoccobacillus gibsonii]